MFQCQIFVTKSPAYTPTNWYLKFSKIWSIQKDAEIILTKKNRFTGRYCKNNRKTSKHVFTYINLYNVY